MSDLVDAVDPVVDAGRAEPFGTREEYEAALAEIRPAAAAARWLAIGPRPGTS